MSEIKLLCHCKAKFTPHSTMELWEGWRTVKLFCKSNFCSTNFNFTKLSCFSSVNGTSIYLSWYQLGRWKYHGPTKLSVILLSIYQHRINMGKTNVYPSLITTFNTSWWAAEEKMDRPESLSINLDSSSTWKSLPFSPSGWKRGDGKILTSFTISMSLQCLMNYPTLVPDGLILH